MIRFGTPQARWVIAATVLGSGIAFLDGTVVNVALPAIAEDLDAGVSDLQWVLDAYLVTLTAFLLLGGALGDHFGRRRVFEIGLVAFTIASVLCAIAPNASLLSLARALQGAGGALLVPGSLAIIAGTFADEDRGRAVGAWSGLSGVTSALGPFLGGWLIDAWSWRLVFLINVPLAAATFVIARAHVPESRSADPQPLDWIGAVLASIGLATGAWSLIEGGSGFGSAEIAAAIVAAAVIVAFLVWEARNPHPMLPLRLFRSAQFSGTNGTTLAVYAALSGATFLVVFELQVALGYSALEAGASLLPITVLMLLLSARMGALAQRIGPRGPMTIGPLVVGAGMLLYTRVEPGASFWTSVLPAGTVFGLGLAITVAPLTATVLAAVRPSELGIASGVNNAAARLAGLLAVAVLPAAVGLDATAAPDAFTDTVGDAMLICAALCLVGAVVAFLTVRTAVPMADTTAPNVLQPCNDPCLAEAS